MAITGTEQVGFTLILTEGFGTIPMAPKTFTLLSGHAGHKASISGATQIRAGVIRPEIIIPQPHIEQARRSALQREGIRIGDPVRIIRDPLFGQIGEVSRLPSGAHSEFRPKAKCACSKSVLAMERRRSFLVPTSK